MMGFLSYFRAIISNSVDYAWISFSYFSLSSRLSSFSSLSLYFFSNVPCYFWYYCLLILRSYSMSEKARVTAKASVSSGLAGSDIHSGSLSSEYLRYLQYYLCCCSSAAVLLHLYSWCLSFVIATDRTGYWGWDTKNMGQSLACFSSSFITFS